MDPTISVVGIGLANSKYVFYINMLELSADDTQKLYDKLAEVELIAHNTIFDSAFMYRDTGRWLNWIGCTLVLFKQLAAEGWAGQRWGLDVAIPDILGWPESNKDTLTTLLKKHKLTKNQMYKLATLEPKLFAEYCGNDADASYQLWKYFTRVTAKPELTSVQVWHEQEFLTSIKLLVEQQFAGIHISQHALQNYVESLGDQIAAKLVEFFAHEDVAKHLRKLRKDLLIEHKNKEPKKYTKANNLAARWVVWARKGGDIAEVRQFNPNSKQQLAWLSR
jgi:hypothetical protein